MCHRCVEYKIEPWDHILVSEILNREMAMFYRFFDGITCVAVRSNEYYSEVEMANGDVLPVLNDPDHCVLIWGNKEVTSVEALKYCNWSKIGTKHLVLR